MKSPPSMITSNGLLIVWKVTKSTASAVGTSSKNAEGAKCYYFVNIPLMLQLFWSWNM